MLYVKRIIMVIVLIGTLIGISAGCKNPFLDKSSPSTLTGKIKDKEDRPLEDAIVTTDPAITIERTKRDGQYKIGDIPPGKYKLIVSKPGYRRSENNIEIKEAFYSCESGNITRDIVLEEAITEETGEKFKIGDILGRIRDSNGNEIKEVKITTEPFTLETKTDSKGLFILTEINTGIYRVKGSKNGYKDKTQDSVAVEVGKRTEIEMTIYENVQLGDIKGKVTNFEGIGIEGATVKTMPSTDTKTTDEGGNYEITGVEPRDYMIIAIKEGYDSLTKTINVKSTEIAGGDIVLNEKVKIMSTIAGTGIAGYNGDGILASSAQLNGPVGITMDNLGNIYIVERHSHRIRKIDNSGIITTIAGTGDTGFSGDGGPATSAKLDGPLGIALDGSGNIYIADAWNHRIRRVDNFGLITTIAGTGVAGYSGDGGPATTAQLNGPSEVAVDGSGNIYIADYSNHRIRRVDNFGLITTIAGTGVTGFSGDGGPATSARLYYPVEVVIDIFDNIYIFETHNGHRIRKINTSGVITTIAGTGIAGFSGDGGPATSAQLYYPMGILCDAQGNIYIADNNNHRIRKINSYGTITSIAGTGVAGYSGDNGPATSAQLNGPYETVLDASGNIYIVDTNNNRIRKFVK